MGGMQTIPESQIKCFFHRTEHSVPRGLWKRWHTPNECKNKHTPDAEGPKQQETRKKCIVHSLGGVSGDGETSGGMWGGVWGGVMTIREKFRPVKVSLLPIVLLIKAVPAPVLIEGLSLFCSPFLSFSLSFSFSFSWQLVCRGGQSCSDR